jgi:FixJ family two-component response regulator
MSAGADDYLIKPFKNVNFLEAVEIYLQKMGLQQAEVRKNFYPANEFPEETKGLNELQVFLADKYRTIAYKKKQALFYEEEIPTYITHTRKYLQWTS